MKPAPNATKYPIARRLVTDRRVTAIAPTTFPAAATTAYTRAPFMRPSATPARGRGGGPWYCGLDPPRRPLAVVAASLQHRAPGARPPRSDLRPARRDP